MMERLTRRMCGGYGMNPGHELNTVQGMRDAIDRLAAYEDTGLEPSEVKAKCAWADKMCKTLSDIFGDSGVFDFSHFKELSKAESEGRLLVLPYNVGDTVYTIIHGKIYEGEVYHISYSNYYGKVTSIVWTKKDFLPAGFGAYFEHFGKTTFHTREEAEAALKKEEEG